MTIRQQIMGDLYEAMKSRRSDVVSTLRTLLGEIANAEAVAVDTDFVPMIGRTNDVPRKHLTDDDIRQILQGRRSGIGRRLRNLKGSDDWMRSKSCN
jgi:uncharacterized protein YqeY